MRTLLSVFCGVMGVLLISGCGGGSGTIQPPESSVSIHFPPPLSEMSDAWVTVSGTTSGPAEIASLSVNGIQATSSDGFVSWEAQVPLAPGVNELRAVALYASSGSTSEAAVTVVGQGTQEIVATALTQEAGYFVFDPGQRRLLGAISNTDPSELLSVDADGGYRHVIVGSHPQAGMHIVSLGSTHGAAFDPVRHRLMTVARFPVIGSSEYGVVAVEPDSGLVETLTPSSVDARAPVYDALRDRLLYYDLNTQAIVAVDFGTLASTTISSSTVGGGPPLLTLPSAYDLRLVVDEANDRILFVAFGDGTTPVNALLSVDPLSGNRSPLPLTGIEGVYRGAAWDPVASELLLIRETANPQRVDLVGFDPQSGTGRVIAASVFVGDWSWMSLAIDPVLHRAFMRGPQSILAIDLASAGVSQVSSWAEVGGLTCLSSTLDPVRNVVYALVPGTSTTNLIKGFEVATGEELFSWDPNSVSVGNTVPAILRWDPVASRILWRHQEELHALDPMTQTFSIVSSANQAMGNGPPLPTYAWDQGMAISADGSRVWIPGGASLYEVDLITGDRSLIDEPQPGSPGAWSIREVVADEARGRLICNSGPVIFEYDLNSGTRAVLAVEGLGSGPQLGFIRGLLVEPETGHILISDYTARGILRVDPATGDRSYLREGLGYADLAGFTSQGTLVLSRFLPDQQVAFWGSGLGMLRLGTGEFAFVRSSLP